MTAFFLTGTDTEIGKTFSACALLHAWRSQGHTAAGYKPVAAGAEWIDGQWCNEDALRLQAASTPGISLARINPVCLQHALAPHLAARAEQREIERSPLIAGFEQISGLVEHVLVEGVGGFRVPLGRDFDSADLAVSLGLPVILVVGMRLGCLNHALLTAEAIQSRGLQLAGWIGNSLADPMLAQAQNVQTLSELLPAPCLGVLPHVPSADPARVAHCLALPA